MRLIAPRRVAAIHCFARKDRGCLDCLDSFRVHRGGEVMKARVRATALAARWVCVGVASTAGVAAWAQDTTQRVEITGSSIKRTDAETALPVQVLTRQEIQATGAVNVEQLLQSVS